MTRAVPTRMPARPRRLAGCLPGVLMSGLLACSPGQPRTAPAAVAAASASAAPLAPVPAPASSPATPALLEPGHVQSTVFLSGKKGRLGQYRYQTLIRWSSYLAAGPDGSLYFDAGPGGSGYPLVRVTPQGRVTALAAPEMLDPRHGMYYDFGPLAVTPQGRVYVLYRGLCEVLGPQRVVCPPLRDAQGRVWSDAAYPNLQLLAAGPDGRVYVSDVRSIGWVGTDGILHPLVSWKPVDPQGPWRGSRIEPTVGAVIDMTVGEDGSLYVAGNPRRGQVDLVKISPSGQVQKLLTWPGGFQNIGHLVAGPKGYLYILGALTPGRAQSGLYRLSPEGKLDLLLPPGDYGGLAVDRWGNVYTGSMRDIYKISPRP